MEAKLRQKPNEKKRCQEFDYGSGSIFPELVAIFNHIKVLNFS